MEYEYTPNKYICGEPPVIQKTREVFSSSALILAAVLGLLSAIVLPIFFDFKLPAGDLHNFCKTLFVDDFAAFLPNVFLFLSVLTMCVKFKKTHKQIKASVFTAFYLFITLTPLTTLYLFCDEFDVLSNTISFSVANIIAILATVLTMIIHLIAACRLKRAVKVNIPSRAFVLLSALVFMLCQSANAVYVTKNIFLGNGGAPARFQYAECIGSALFIALTLTASLIISVKLITYHTKIGRVKKAFKVNIKENI